MERPTYTSALLFSAAAICLIALRSELIGWLFLGTGVIVAFNAPRRFWQEMLVVAGAIAVLSLAPVGTDISNDHFLALAIPMLSLIIFPALIFRSVFKDAAIRFSLRNPQPLPKRYGLYFALIVVAGYFIMPLYLINSGVYLNWPAAPTTDSFIRLFIGTNLLGTWDELFFICSLLVIYRRHFPLWTANIFTSVVMVSFLYDLGFKGYGPLLAAIFTLSQGFMYLKTKSLAFVLSVHLALDLILFLVLVHAHQPARFDWFVI